MLALVVEKHRAVNREGLWFIFVIIFKNKDYRAMLEGTKVTLILNYPADEQQSMIRFGAALANSLTSAGLEICLWTPPVIFGRLLANKKSFNKWLAYIDKFILGMFTLAWSRIRSPTCHWHIVDHGNAGYLLVLPPERTTVTCHDCIAIEEPLNNRTGEPVGRFGHLLQRWISWGLVRAKHVIPVSSATADDLTRLVNIPVERMSVIHNSVVASYSPQSSIVALARLNAAGIPTDKPFIFMVGSNHARKNRKGAIDIFNALRQLSPVSRRLILAGKPWSPEVKEAAIQSPWKLDIIETGTLADETLEAAYSAAEVVIFPSLAEGFGLPIIEGQACGALVVTSNIPPMPEVGGMGAYYADPRNPLEFAQAILNAINNKTTIKQAAKENIKRFSTETMAQRYKEVFGIEKSTITTTDRVCRENS